MSDTETLAARLDAVERALVDGDGDLTDVQTATDLDERLTTVETRLDELAESMAEQEAALLAVRGYVGAVRSVNESVEQKADLALARTEGRDETDGAGPQSYEEGDRANPTDVGTRANQPDGETRANPSDDGTRANPSDDENRTNPGDDENRTNPIGNYPSNSSAGAARSRRASHRDRACDGGVTAAREPEPGEGCCETGPIRDERGRRTDCPRFRQTASSQDSIPARSDTYSRDEPTDGEDSSPFWRFLGRL